MATRHDASQFPRRWREEIWEKRNVEAVDDLVAPDFRGQSPGLPGPIEGRAGVREFVETVHAAFPDLEVALEEFVAEGDAVAVRHTLSGTHDGAFPGVEATGEPIEVAHVGFLHLADGVLAREWEMADHHAPFAQVGVVDSPTGEPGGGDSNGSHG